jgi:hypothetical protein
MRFERVSQELIPIRPLVQNPNLDRSDFQVVPSGLNKSRARFARGLPGRP